MRVRCPAGETCKAGSAKNQIKRKLRKGKFQHMCRLLLFLLVFSTFISCSKNEGGSLPPVVIPDVVEGTITEFNVTPLDINTPDKGEFLIAVNNTVYKVDFNAAAQSASNATITFASDTILTDESREFANFGKDAIAYNPVAENQILILFNDGKKVNGSFNLNTSFGGVFGEALISQWRDPGDPAKPTQKAKNDIINLVQRYSDLDGPGPETTRQYLIAKVTKK